jgi:hypothetical protein
MGFALGVVFREDQLTRRREDAKEEEGFCEVGDSVRPFRARGFFWGCPG